MSTDLLIAKIADAEVILTDDTAQDAELLHAYHVIENNMDELSFRAVNGDIKAAVYIQGLEDEIRVAQENAIDLSVSAA